MKVLIPPSVGPPYGRLRLRAGSARIGRSIAHTISPARKASIEVIVHEAGSEAS